MKRFIAIFVIAMASWTVSRPARGAEDTASQPALKTARAVAVEYYLSLPTGWSHEKQWPIVVVIDGSGHDFPNCSQNFVRARGDRPFIVVVPCVRSNGKDPADLAAVLAIVKEVQHDYHGRPKFFVTGFSAGGHVAWQLVFNHPELLAGAAPAAANFRFRGIGDASMAKEGRTLPVHGFNGGKDAGVINAQWDDAEKLARERGYQNLKHTLVAAAGHTPFADEVMQFFAALLAE